MASTSRQRMLQRSAVSQVSAGNSAGRQQLLFWCLLALPIPLAVLALGLGRYELSPNTVMQILGHALAGQPPQTAIERLVLAVRLPRILAALLIGAGLAGSGAAFQGIFKNPLVDSNILGVTSGAGFGAALALLLIGSTLVAGISAFAFGMLAVLLTFIVSRAEGSSHALMLTLSGILVGSFFTALTSLIKTLADPLDTLPAITFWLLGSLSNVTWRSLPVLAAVTLIGCCGLTLIRWQINILSLGDREAMALGLDARRMKILITGLASLMTAIAVAVGGLIGWVGLVIPHAARLLVGPDHKRMLPVAFSLGASFLLIIDTLSRTALPNEVPLGVFTGLIGVPALFWLLHRRRSGWEWS
jgi:iron complex transport system permease protein